MDVYEKARRLEDKARRRLEAGQAKKAAGDAERAVDLRLKDLRRPPSLADAMVLAGACRTAAGQPVTGLLWRARGVLVLIENASGLSVADTEYGFQDVQSAITAALGGVGSIPDATIQGGVGRLADGLDELLAPLRDVPGTASRQRVEGWPKSEIKDLASMMARVNEVATFAAERGWQGLSLRLYDGVISLGWNTRRLGPEFRRSAIRALIDKAGAFQRTGQYRPMWLWLHYAIDIAMPFAGDPTEDNLRAMAETLALVQRGLSSAGLYAQADRFGRIVVGITEAGVGRDASFAARDLGDEILELANEVDRVLY